MATMASMRITGQAMWARMERAVEKVQQRLKRATAVLEQAGIPYAVVGGNAVRIWVAQVDEAAVRTTREVDVLLRRDDLDRAVAAMEAAGFTYCHAANLTMFLESPESSARDAVHIVFSGEMVRAGDPEANPDVEPFEVAEDFRTLPLERLVRMKLNSFRLKDRVHLLDMLDAGLIDASWPARFPETLGQRLQGLIDNPNQ
jgi:hypothetical protein